MGENVSLLMPGHPFFYVVNQHLDQSQREAKFLACAEPLIKTYQLSHFFASPNLLCTLRHMRGV